MTEANRILRQDERSRARSLRHPRITQARFEARSLAGQHRHYVSYLRLKHRALGWPASELWTASIVDRHTDVVIEAFPRSGNTFSLAAFLSAQPGEVRVGHHVCHPAQVLAATRLAVPVLVIAREPHDTILSARQWSPLISTTQWLRLYTRYYEKVGSVARRTGAVLVVDFRELTTDFGAVITRLNRHFGSTFQAFEHTKENVERCYRMIESNDELRFGAVTEARVSRPSDDRRSEADRYSAELLRPEHARGLSRAERAFRSALDASPSDA